MRHLCDSNVFIALAVSGQLSAALSSRSSPKLWMDAYLAAFAELSGMRFVTFDKAFRQFPKLDLLLLGS